jgi:hypothetical protein
VALYNPMGLAVQLGSRCFRHKVDRSFRAASPELQPIGAGTPDELNVGFGSRPAYGGLPMVSPLSGLERSMADKRQV